MLLVRTSIALTKAATKAKMSRMERRNRMAIKRLKESQAAVQSTGVDLMATQVNVAAQLTQLNETQRQIGKQIETQIKKQKALDAAVEIVS